MDGFLTLYLPLLASPFIGSFLSVVAERVPKGEPWVLSRSKCRSCHHQLGPIDLIPVLSYLAHYGRCRFCSNGIPIRHLFVELSALGVAITAVLVMPTQLIWPTCILGWILLALAIIDLEHQILPDLLVIPLLIVGLLVGFFLLSASPFTLFSGAIIGFLSLYIVGLFYRLLRGRDGLGLGDAKLLSAGGVWIGVSGLLSVLMVASVLALLLSPIFVRADSATFIRTAAIPFGPFLAFGIWFTWLFGPIA